MLGAEGSQLFKVKGKYYLFNITWPRGGVRTVIVHRADKITGPYEGRVVFQDRGIAQGGLVDTPDGRWFAYLFEDCGAVGRIPYLVPVEWKIGWPVWVWMDVLLLSWNCPIAADSFQVLLLLMTSIGRKENVPCRWYGNGITIRTILFGRFLPAKGICG